MGAYSTLYVSREAVKEAITNYLDIATNEELANALLSLWHNNVYYNYKIHTKNNGKEDDLLKRTIDQLRGGMDGGF